MKRSIVLLNVSGRIPQFGDVYLVRFEGSGSEQSGLRPAVIFQNNVGNAYSPNVTVLPMTSRIKKSSQPTHVVIQADGSGLLRDSMVLCENPVCVSKEKLGAYLLTLSDEQMGRIAEANMMASAAIAYINPELLIGIWQRAARLNSVRS